MKNLLLCFIISLCGLISCVEKLKVENKIFTYNGK